MLMRRSGSHPDCDSSNGCLGFRWSGLNSRMQRCVVNELSWSDNQVDRFDRVETPFNPLPGHKRFERTAGGTNEWPAGHSRRRLPAQKTLDVRGPQNHSSSVRRSPSKNGRRRRREMAILMKFEPFSGRRIRSNIKFGSKAITPRERRTRFRCRRCVEFDFPA